MCRDIGLVWELHVPTHRLLMKFMYFMIDILRSFAGESGSVKID